MKSATGCLRCARLIFLVLVESEVATLRPACFVCVAFSQEFISVLCRSFFAQFGAEKSWRMRSTDSPLRRAAAIVTCSGGRPSRGTSIFSRSLRSASCCVPPCQMMPVLIDAGEVGEGSVLRDDE